MIYVIYSLLILIEKLACVRVFYILNKGNGPELRKTPRVLFAVT